MDRRLSFRTLNRRLRAIVGHGVVSTGAQRRDRLGFSTRRLRHLQFQPHPGRHPAGNAVRLQLHVLADNIADFIRTLALPKAVGPWSLTSLREKLIKIGARGRQQWPLISRSRWRKS